MKSNELRIGNWLNDFAMESHQVIHLSKDKTILETPIPLIEKWLLKFGFIQNDYFFRVNNFVIKKTYEGFVPIGDKYSIGVEIQYVHQLQNLYFALTGQELEIK